MNVIADKFTELGYMLILTNYCQVKNIISNVSDFFYATFII